MIKSKALCSIICFIIILGKVSLSSAIEGAEADYSYENFLRKPYTEFFEIMFESDDTKQYHPYTLSFWNAHYFKGFFETGSELMYGDFLVGLNSKYCEDLYSSSLKIGSDNHSLNLNYESWQHKEDFPTLRFKLANVFKVDLGNTRLSLVNFTNFYHTLQPLSILESLDQKLYYDASIDNFGLNIGFQKPFGSVDNFNLQACLFFCTISTTIGLGANHFLNHDDSFSPVFIYQQFLSNNLLLRTTYYSYFETYPLERHLRDFSFLFASQLPKQLEDFTPFRAEKIDFSIEHNTKRINHKLSAELIKSDYKFDIDWFYEGNEAYTITKVNEDVLSMRLSYFFTRYDMNGRIRFFLKDKMYSEPLMETYLEWKYFRKYNNFITLGAGAIYDFDLGSAIINNREVIPFLKIGYTFQIFSDLLIDLNATHMFHNFQNTFLNNSTSLFVQLNYGGIGG